MTTSVKKSHLLDPLNVIFKLSLLNICEYGTRLSISKHIVTVQPPTISQFLSRKWNYDGRDDLYLLLRSIVKIVEWYNTEHFGEEDEKHKKLDDSGKKKKKLDDSGNKIIVIQKTENKFYKNPNLKILMDFACRGIEKLQKFYEKQYEDGMFILGLQFIVNVLKEGIDGKIDHSKLPVNYRKMDTLSLIHIREIIKFWTDESITKVVQLLQDSEKYCEKEVENRTILNGYMQSILTILVPLDTEFQKMITRSYS